MHIHQQNHNTDAQYIYVFTFLRVLHLAAMLLMCGCGSLFAKKISDTQVSEIRIIKYVIVSSGKKDLYHVNPLDQCTSNDVDLRIVTETGR